MSATPAFIARIDEPRTLPNQDLIRDLMIDEVWRTYREVGNAVGLPAETIGSHLRNLRMEKGGGYVLCRKPRLRREAGLYEYQMLPPGSISEFDSAKEPKVVAEKPKRDPFLSGLMFAANVLVTKYPKLKGTVMLATLKDEIEKLKGTSSLKT